MLHWTSHTEIIGRITLGSSHTLFTVRVARKVGSALTVAKNVSLCATQTISLRTISAGVKTLQLNLEGVGCIIFNNFVTLLWNNTISISLNLAPLVPKVIPDII